MVAKSVQPVPKRNRARNTGTSMENMSIDTQTPSHACPHLKQKRLLLLLSGNTVPRRIKLVVDAK